MYAEQNIHIKKLENINDDNLCASFFLLFFVDIMYVNYILKFLFENQKFKCVYFLNVTYYYDFMYIL